MTAAVRVRALCDVSGVEGSLRALMEWQWPRHYGPGGRGDAVRDLTARHRATGLPYGVVALAGDVAVGTAALAATSHGALPGEPCWIVGLVVAPDHRRRGIGAAMITALESAARAQGAAAVFTTTATANRLFERCGWQVLRRLADGHDVLRRDLG